jgi:mycoredoxin
MTTEQTPSITVIEFYWRPRCPFCSALRRPLARSGLPVREVNIWEDEHAAARVRQATGGNETVPTVFVGERALVNPGFRQVREAVQTYAPHLLQEAAQSADGRPRRRWPFVRK